MIPRRRHALALLASSASLLLGEALLPRLAAGAELDVPEVPSLAAPIPAAESAALPAIAAPAGDTPAVPHLPDAQAQTVPAAEAIAAPAPDAAPAAAQAEPAYRGVARAQVVDSLHRAETFLRGLNLGPATAQQLDHWLDGRPFDALAAAQDDRALAQAMGQAQGPFRRYGEVFAHHAALDPTVKRLHYDLSSWGAFNGMELADYRPIDQEMDSHLARSYAGRMPSVLSSPEGQARLAEAVSGLAQDEQEARWLKRAVPLSLALAQKDRARFDAFFARQDLRNRHMLVQALRYLSGDLYEREVQVARESPAAIGRYGISVPGLPLNFAEMQKALAPLLEKAHQVLEPFYHTDEIQMTAIGLITDDRAHTGFVFSGTRRAAQALADALPDQLIVDAQGRRVEPRR